MTQPQPKRYQRATSLATNIWLDTQTGESFGPGETAAYQRFQQWLADGNAVDSAPATVVAPTPVDTSRAGKIAKLAATAKQGLQAQSINTPGEKAIATIFGQALDALAALDPLPTDPPPMTVPTPVPPPPVAPIPAPIPSDRKPVMIQ